MADAGRLGFALRNVQPETGTRLSGVATAFDVPLRSFVVDVAPIFHPSFVWSERVHNFRHPVLTKTC